MAGALVGVMNTGWSGDGSCAFSIPSSASPSVPQKIYSQQYTSIPYMMKPLYQLLTADKT